MSKLQTAWKNEATGDIHSPKGRLLWPKLLKAERSRKFPERAPQFSGGLLIPKAANIDALKEEIARVGAEVHGKDWSKKGLNLCLKQTASIEKLAEFAEAFPYLLNAAANEGFPPFVFGPDAKPYNAADVSGVYGGRWAVIAGSAWGSKTGKGNVGWNLNRVQLLDHDEPIGGGRSATAEGFEAVEVSGSAPSGGASDGSADGIWN